MTVPAYPHHAKIEEFRRKEMEARLCAVAIEDEFMRAAWEHIAGNYHELAERLERNGKL